MAPPPAAGPPPVPPTTGTPPPGSAPHAEPHPDPKPEGVPLATLETAPPRRSRAWMVVIVVLLLAAMAGAFALQGGEAPSDPPTAERLSVTSAASFDPQGDNGTEHEDQVLNALDQNPNTAWRSERYGDPEAMAGKDGVGLILTLDGSQEIGQVDVRSPEGGWSAQIYVHDGDAPTELAGWGDPLASVQGADAGLTRFAPIDASGNQVLVWFTRTADSGEVAVTEVSVQAP